jgi:histidinol-phosphate/aromatic aminotransferase/cobyric acid decarboxylase-like protein
MYEIVLYNNGKRVKVIKKYNLYTNAIKNYRSMIKNNKVYFNKETLWNGSKTDYELGLTAPNKNKPKEYFRNEFGAMVKIKTKGNFVLKQINKYFVEEVFTDKLNNKKIVFRDLIKYLLKKKDTTCVIYVINNKVFIEYFENDDVDLYVLKNKDDAYRLSETIKEFVNVNQLTNFIFFQDPTLENKIRIYDLLQEQYKITREYMYRIGTR